MNIKKLKKIEKPLRNVFAALGFVLAWIIIFLIGYSFVPQFNYWGNTVKHFNIDPQKAEKFVSSVIFAPLVEELLFRVFPIQIMKQTNTLDKLKIPVCIGISITFGFIHGSNWNCFVQGALGITLCWLYIKNNFSYWSIVFVHSFYNFTVAFALPYIYHTS